jgi:alpha-mannosidase
VLTLHVKPSPEGTVVRLLNTSDSPQQATIRAGLLSFQSAQRCDLFEQPEAELAVTQNQLSLELAPRQVVTVKLC